MYEKFLIPARTDSEGHSPESKKFILNNIMSTRVDAVLNADVFLIFSNHAICCIRSILYDKTTVSADVFLKRLERKINALSLSTNTFWGRQIFSVVSTCMLSRGHPQSSKQSKAIMTKTNRPKASNAVLRYECFQTLLQYRQLRSGVG